MRRFSLIMGSPLNPEKMALWVVVLQSLDKQALFKNFLQKKLTTWYKQIHRNPGCARHMAIPLQHLIDFDEITPLAPQVQRGALNDLIKSPRTAREALDAKALSVAALMAAGMEVSIDEAEETEAMQQFYQASEQLPIRPATKPAVILKLSALMTEYDHEVVHEAAAMRLYVTNRLFEESDPHGKTPKALQLRALEMLGKITEVGLFTERSEVTVKNLPQENLEEALYAKLKLLLPAVQDAEIISETPREERAA